MNPRLVMVMVPLLFVTAMGLGQDVATVKRIAVEVGGHKGFVMEPPKPGPEGSRPWVWYAPVIGPHPSRETDWMFRRLFDAGIYVVGVNVGESMGNPAGRKGYSAFYEHVVREFKLEPKARLLAQSRGGLMLYNWAVENPDKVQCVAGIYPVCDLRSYPKLPRAAEAYGLTVAELEKVLAQHNPVDRLEPLAKARVPVLHIHGDSDKVVPLEANSKALIDRYRELGGPAEVIVVAGKGHEAVKEFFEEPRMVEFLKAGGLPVKRKPEPGR